MNDVYEGYNYIFNLKKDNVLAGYSHIHLFGSIEFKKLLREV